MTEYTAEQSVARALVEGRRARIFAVIGRPTEPNNRTLQPLSSERLQFFRREAEELYWNELTWEQLTGEETITGGHLTDLVFPGFLTFVDGLLAQPMSADGRTTRPYPEAVESILTFLGERFAILSAELEGGIDSEKVVWARAMTLGLIDLVLYRLYRLSPEEREEVESLG